jgi:hypothetical protein
VLKTRNSKESQPPELKGEEKKIIMIPRVVASEKGRAQTYAACCVRVVGLHLESVIKLNHLES